MRMRRPHGHSVVKYDRTSEPNGRAAAVYAGKPNDNERVNDSELMTWFLSSVGAREDGSLTG